MGRPKKIVLPITYRSFENCIDTINLCINKRRHRWTLTSISFMDFNDVAQILRAHIFKKWHLYNQEKKLESWLTTVINNQMINLIRNVFSNFSRPCLKCEFYEGENLCCKFGTQNVVCDSFRTWVYGKKTKYDIQLALPMENHSNEVSGISQDNLDIDKTMINGHERMKKSLKPLYYLVFKYLYIDHLPEEEVAKKLKFKSAENRTAGYGRISQIKKIIIETFKKELYSGEIEIIKS